MAIKFFASGDPEMISKLRLYAAEKDEQSLRSCVHTTRQAEVTFHLIKFQFPVKALEPSFD